MSLDDFYIYRDFELSRTSVTAAGKFIQAMVLCRGNITCMFSLNNGFPDESVGSISSFYRLQFKRIEDLEKFHSMGFKTTEIAKVNLN
jgi:hypothetical protein